MPICLTMISGVIEHQDGFDFVDTYCWLGGQETVIDITLP